MIHPWEDGGQKIQSTKPHSFTPTAKDVWEDVREITLTGKLRNLQQIIHP